MIWHWLGQVPPQSVRPELISTYDFLPTVCDLLDLPAPSGRNLSGRSYLPILMGKPLPKKSPWRKVVFGQYRNTEMARDSRLKLVLRNGGNGPNELYDLADDPREKVNQYDNSKYMIDRAQMTGTIEKWRQATAT
jgi:arylsulfatase A-like enzyme